MSIEFLNSLIMMLTLLVGILSVLVMILIGLQINQYVKLGKMKKKLKKDIKQIYDKGTAETDKNNMIALLGVHHITRYMAIRMELQDTVSEYIKSAMYTIMYYVKLNDFSRCDTVVHQLINDMQNKNIKLSESDKKEIVNISLLIPSRDKIKDFAALDKLLITLPVYPDAVL
jgi:hypothetical protein